MLPAALNIKDFNNGVCHVMKITVAESSSEGFKNSHHKKMKPLSFSFNSVTRDDVMTKTTTSIASDQGQVLSYNSNLIHKAPHTYPGQ